MIVRERGLLRAIEASPVARILDRMPGAVFPFFVCEALLAEHCTVPVRLNLPKRHGLTIAAVGGILTDLAQHAIAVGKSQRRRRPILMT